MDRRSFDLALDAWAIISGTMASTDLDTISDALTMASTPEVRASARTMQDATQAAFKADIGALTERWHAVA